MGSLTEENYIKSVYALSQATGEVYVSELAKKLDVKLPSVNSMMKRMATKKLVAYAPYKGIKLTEKGKKEALAIIRKHRLAELFLVKVMGLGWEEVHDIAEQLEHVNSSRFYERIDELLNNPKFDPHGEPIPDSNGKIHTKKRTSLIDLAEGLTATITAVTEDEKSFLDHLNAKGLQIGDVVIIKKRELFDGSITLQHKSKKEILLTHQVAERIWVEV
ncbi:MAG: metal-dependent transcriptional regulator [Cyclobacteriaceae bacterium]|jgi:DtxR family Mn-dependent transcriptional regulator|nr:metal-dependent transcriptional regulator [Cyclobacteriaceae bacterium]